MPSLKSELKVRRERFWPLFKIQLLWNCGQFHRRKEDYCANKLHCTLHNGSVVSSAKKTIETKVKLSSLPLAFFWRMAFLFCSSFELSIMGSMAAGPAKSGRSFYARGHWVVHENTTTPCMQCLSVTDKDLMICAGNFTETSYFSKLQYTVHLFFSKLQYAIHSLYGVKKWTKMPNAIL